MVEKLVFLCSEVLAKDHAKQRLPQFKLLFRTALPTPVLSFILSSLPLNSLIQLEEDCPGNPVLEERWQELCFQCSKNHVPFRKKLSLKDGGKKQCFKEFFLNSYFKEILDTCSQMRNSQLCAKIPRIESQHILQDSIGSCKHDTSDEEILLILSKHITKLTVHPKYIFCLQDLIKSHDFTLRKLKYLRLVDTCTLGARTDEWIFCVRHVLKNSHLQFLSTSTCCQILNHILGIESNHHICKSNSSLWDEAVTFGGLSTDFKDNVESRELLHIFDDFGDSYFQPPDYFRITELTLSSCRRPEVCRHFCEGIEHICSLEKLTVSCALDEERTLYFLKCILKLLQSGSSRLKYIHFDGALLETPSLVTKHIKEAHSLDDEVISTDESVPEDLPELGRLNTNIEGLALSGIVMQQQRSKVGFASLKRLLSNLVFVCNPVHLWMSWNERALESSLPYFLIPESTSPNRGSRNRLQKITVVYQSSSLDYQFKIQPLVLILRVLVSLLETSTKDADLAIYCDVPGLPVASFRSSFKSLELTLLKKPVSTNSVEDFVSQM